MVGSRAEYLAQFAGATTQRIVGEASPFYLYSRTAGREIRAFCPDAFIVIMVRNPRETLRAARDALYRDAARGRLPVENAHARDTGR